MEIAINKLFAQLLFWLYELLDTIFSLFEVLGGIYPVDANGESVSLIEIFLTASSVTRAFMLLVLVSIVVAAVSIIIAVIRNIVNVKGGDRKSNAAAVGQGFGVIVTSLVMALVMLMGISMSNIVLKKVYEATLVTDPEISISAQLFDMCVGQSYVYDYGKPFGTPVYILNEYGDKIPEIDAATGEVKKDEQGNTIYLVERDADGNIIYEYTYGFKLDENGNPALVSGWQESFSAKDLNFSTMNPNMVFGVHKKILGIFEDEKSPYEDDKKPMVEMQSFNFFIAYLVVIVMLVSIIWSMLALVKRIYDLVMLFIILPLVSGTIPLDDGARFKHWRESVVSKVVLAYGVVLSINVFLLIVPVIKSIDFNALGWTPFVQSLFKMFMLMGGALSINSGQLLIARVVGSSADESREMAHSARALVSGTMGAATGVRGVKNLVFGGYNKYGRHRQGAIPASAKAADFLGNHWGETKYSDSKIATVLRKVGGVNPSKALRGIGPNSGATRNEDNNYSAKATNIGVDKAVSDATTHAMLSAPSALVQNQINTTQSSPQARESSNKTTKHDGLINNVVKQNNNDGAYRPQNK